MVELIIAIATLAIVIMSWSKVSKALDWAGNQVSNTTDIFEDLTTAGSVQTARAVVISSDTLEDTVHESAKKSAKRQEDRAKFMKGLNKEQTDAVTTQGKRFDKYLKRV